MNNIFSVFFDLDRPWYRVQSTDGWYHKITIVATIVPGYVLLYAVHDTHYMIGNIHE